MIGRQDYTPFGTPVLNGTSMPREGFGGNEKDDETQQMYFHARSLAARTGRFNSPDAVFGAMDEPQRWNRYAYALNQPLHYLDPFGTNAERPGNPFTCSNPEAYAELHCGTLEMWYLMILTGGPSSSAGSLEGTETGAADPVIGSTTTTTTTTTGGETQNGSSKDDTNQKKKSADCSDDTGTAAYFSFQMTIAIPNPFTGTAAGVALQLSVDRFGNIFAGGGAAYGKSLLLASAAASFGFLKNRPVFTSADTNSFLTGPSGNASLGAGPGVGFTNSPSSNMSAREYGLYTPQAGFSGVTSKRIGSLRGLAGLPPCSQK